MLPINAEESNLAISPMRRVKRIHFVGIGGVGMSGIAEVLLNEGYVISGSDTNENSNTKHLISLGAKVFTKHQLENVKGADVVVISSAITKGNPEVIEAINLRIPVISRAEMLAELMRFRIGIAIAGTHGKTTTTSLVSTLLAEGDLDPTYVIGGRLNSAGSNAKLGTGKYLVAEADESDASFLLLKPTYAIVTNIDLDHMATYKGSFTELRQTFLDFLHHLPFYGLAVLCLDDKNIKDLLSEIKRPILTYDFDSGADVRASDYVQQELQSYFSLHLPGEPSPVKLRLNLPGKHNVLNALAAIAIAKEVGVSNDAIRQSLDKFAGIGRRFQVFEHIKIPHGEITLVDDYGHHPTEILATLDALRNVWPDRRLIIIFQPHRYTRTRDLFEDFVDVLSQTDLLLLMEVYPAGETMIPGADSRSLCRAIRQRGQLEPIFIENQHALFSIAPNVLTDNDIVLMQGAGNIGQIAQRVVSQGFGDRCDELAR